MASRNRVETTPEQVIYYDPDEVADKKSQSGTYCFRLVVGLVIFFFCAALKGFSKNSSRSTYSSTPTFTRNNDYASPTFTREDTFMGKILTQDILQRNVVTIKKESCDTDICSRIVDDVLNSINKTVDPCDNFYDYACQGWLEKNPRPEHMPEWSIFSKLRTKNTKRVIHILEKPAIISSQQKPLNDAKQFYRKCVDLGNEKNETEEKAAIQLMWNNLEKYGGWPILYENGTWNKSRYNWISSTVGLKRQFESSTLLNVISYQYPHWMEKKNRIYIQPPSSSSSSLEAIDKFVEENKIFEGFKPLENLQNLIVNISKVFLEFQGKSDINQTYLEEQALNTLVVQILLPSAGEPSDQISFRDQLILGMESSSNAANTSLIKIQLVLDKYMLPYKNELNLRKFLSALYENTSVTIRYTEPVIITDLGFLLNLAKFITKTKEEAIANYLSFRMTLLMIPLSGHAKLNSLVDDFQNEILGTSGKKGRKEKCAEITQEKFSVAVGQAFVQTKSGNSDLEFKQAKITFNNLKVSFRKLIESSYVSYFDKPVLKLETKITRLCLGYPSWMDRSDGYKIQSEYKGLVLNESATFLEQNMAINRWAVDKSYSLLRQQLGENDNCRWAKFPGYVGAYNAILQYSVFLPIGIMQPPFYNIFMPTALIYGKLGSILGHEIIHGLAGPGWSELKNGRLTASGKCLVNQYSNFSTPVLRKENVTLNGLATLEENIPDNAGLLGAYNAFKKSTLLDGQVKKLQDLNEFTDEQLFFLGFAQNWCETSSMETLRKSLKSDDHPPGMFRVLGSLQNSNEFAKAWKCRLGSKMNPFPRDHRKCTIF